MKGVYKVGYMIVFLLVVIACGCISPKIKFAEQELEEKYIDVPYVFNLDEGKKIEMFGVAIKRVDYVVSREETWQWNQETPSTTYKIYYPREGFVFYVVNISIENTGGKILNVYTDLPEQFELTAGNNTYDALSFELLTEEKGYTCVESEDDRYESEVCEYFTENLYPGEIGEGSVFFEIRENENPVELRFTLGYTRYHIKIQPWNLSFQKLEFALR